MITNFTQLSLIAIFSCSTTACNFSAQLLNEEDESGASRNSDDTFTGAANPAHPVVRWRKEQKLTLKNAALAQIAEAAHRPLQLLASGQYFSCTLNPKKEIQCWGLQGFGATGKDPEVDSSKRDGTNYFLPYKEKVKKISIMDFSTCILTTDSKLYCHGSNSYGQLGDGSTNNSFKPVVPVGLEDKVSWISSSNNKTCAVTHEGQLRCWGYGLTKTPSKVIGAPEKVMTIALGASHQCLLTKDFGVQCWGSNSDGQLGSKEFTASSATSPIPADGLDTDVVQIGVGGNHTCAVLASGAVKCWGLNNKGQLGIGNNDNQSTPVEVVGLAGEASTLALGNDFSCALLKNGGVDCWGLNASGQLGDATNEDHNKPVPVNGLSKPLVSLSAYDKYVCGVDTDNAAWCWGGNYYDRLGNGPVDGAYRDSNVPVKVSGF